MHDFISKDERKGFFFLVQNQGAVESIQAGETMAECSKRHGMPINKVIEIKISMVCLGIAME